MKTVVFLLMFLLCSGALAEAFRVGAINCDAFGQRTAEITEGQFAAGWADLEKESAADVFFYGNLGGRDFPSGSRGVSGVNARVVASAQWTIDTVSLPGELKVLRLVRNWAGGRLAVYGVFLAAADATRRAEQCRALIADAAKFDAAVFAGDFHAQTAADYQVFVERGFRPGNCSAEYGVIPTAARAGSFIEKPMDNIVVSSNLDFIAFTVAQYFRIDTEHFPVVAHIDLKDEAANWRRSIPSLAEYLARPLAERRMWFADGAFRHQMKKNGPVRGEGLLSRWVEVERIPNLRDVGGLRTQDGRELRRGLIYRSAGWNDNAKTPKGVPESAWIPGESRLTEKGRAQLAQLGIKTDLDLRKANECWRMTASPLGPDVRWIRISFGSYGRFKTKVEFRQAVRQVFDVLADETNYPLVFHCIGGADRTGCLALMIHELCGVDENTAIADWELTGTNTEQLNFVHAKTLDLFLSHLAEYPGATAEQRMRNFLADCGVASEQMESVRRIMLGPERP